MLYGHWSIHALALGFEYFMGGFFWADGHFFNLGIFNEGTSLQNLEQSLKTRGHILADGYNEDSRSYWTMYWPSGISLYL